MNTARDRSALRVLVTGSRGKSSVVRLLHAAFRASGLESWGRITGVEPRQLGPRGTQTILRSAGAHVEEMRWWLRQLPGTAQAVVMENSAISPELQPLAARWLQPDVTVLSNVLPDHQEAWGDSACGAAEALAAGLPAGPVVLPGTLRGDDFLAGLLLRRRCRPNFVTACEDAGEDYRATNLALALGVLETLGLPAEPVRDAMQTLAPDRYDFRVLRHGEAELAMAFSANDIASTRSLFRSLGWAREQTRVVYNHRADRPGRFRSFRDWLQRGPWREVLIVGDRPLRRPANARYLRLGGTRGLLDLVRPGDRVFGCGNIAGYPLALY